VRSAEEGVASMGTQTWSGSLLFVECFEGVSTFSSPIDVPSASLNLSFDGIKVSTYVLAR
jgi:hypothetical protein